MRNFGKENLLTLVSHARTIASRLTNHSADGRLVSLMGDALATSAHEVTWVVTWSNDDNQGIEAVCTSYDLAVQAKNEAIALCKQEAEDNDDPGYLMNEYLIDAGGELIRD